MNLKLNYRRFWKRATDFDGVSGRKEYWTNAVINSFCLPLIFILVSFQRYAFENTRWLYYLWTVVQFGLLIYAVLVISPGLAELYRRFRDAGYSGTVCSVYLIIKYIMLLILWGLYIHPNVLGWLSLTKSYPASLWIGTSTVLVPEKNVALIASMFVVYLLIRLIGMVILCRRPSHKPLTRNPLIHKKEGPTHESSRINS